MFWQGGFTFYAAVVVPVGQVELGPSTQGLVTSQVTNYLNLAGLGALLLLLWELVESTDSSRSRKVARYSLWLVCVLQLGVLTWLHFRLDGLMNDGIVGSAEFNISHRVYLWISTIQWGCGVVYLVLTLLVWRTEDRATTVGNQVCDAG